MDDATRARLDKAAEWDGILPLGVARVDLRALLAAYDALVAERDEVGLEVTQLAEAERTFIEIRRDEWMEIANAMRAERDALLAERDYYLERSDHWCMETALANRRLEPARDKYRALWYETAKMVREERDRQAQAAPVLDDVMTTLDWVSTTTEGTPKQPFLEIHRRVGEQMRRLNAWRAAREG